MTCPFWNELEISQIVVKPEVSDDDKKKIVDRLESIRNDVVVNGSSFATKAICILKTQVRANGWKTNTR